jgi:hypothetical protein
MRETGYATLPDELKRLEQELVVEDLGHARAERARARGSTRPVKDVVHLDSAAHEHVGLAFAQRFATVDPQLPRARDAARPGLAIEAHIRAGPFDAGVAVLLLQQGKRAHAEGQCA